MNEETGARIIKGNLANERSGQWKRLDAEKRVASRFIGDR